MSRSQASSSGVAAEGWVRSTGDDDEARGARVPGRRSIRLAGTSSHAPSNTSGVDRTFQELATADA